MSTPEDLANQDNSNFDTESHTELLQELFESLQKIEDVNLKKEVFDRISTVMQSLRQPVDEYLVNHPEADRRSERSIASILSSREFGRIV